MLTMAGQRCTWSNYFGQHDVAAALLAAGADVHARTINAQNKSAAARCRRRQTHYLVDLLLGSGADVNASQEGGWTALHAAAQDGDTPMIASLLASMARMLMHEMLPAKRH